MSRLFRGAVVGAVVGIVLLAEVGDAGATQLDVGGREYRCAPKTSAQLAPAPTPPSGAAARFAAAGLGAARICPPGELPAPRALALAPPYPPRMHGRAAPPVAPASPEEHFGADYYYAVEGAFRSESDEVTGMQGEAEDQEEAVDSTAGEGHSITQLWALDESGGAPTYSDVEFGTIVSPSFNEGAATLFVYHFDEGAPTCYDGCGYVQLSDVAGHVPGYPLSDPAPLLAPGAAHLYQTYEAGLSGNWYVAVDGEPIGYYPASAWPVRPPKVLTVEEVGGEVETPVGQLKPRTTMGDGAPGVDGAVAEAAAGAPTFWRAIADRPGGASPTLQAASFFPFVQTPGVYTLGSYEGEEARDSSFAYGGSGWCGEAPGYCPLPSVSLSAAAAASASTASVSGRVNPRGVATSYWFEYSPEPFGAWSATSPVAAGEGQSAVPVSAELAGLTPSTSYFFRLAAASADGTERSSWGELATAAPAPAAVVSPPVSATGRGGVSSFTVTAPAAPLRLHALRVTIHGGWATVRLQVSRRCTVTIGGHGLKRLTRLLAAGSHAIRVRLSSSGRVAVRRRRSLAIHVLLADGETHVSAVAHVRA